MRIRPNKLEDAKAWLLRDEFRPAIVLLARLPDEQIEGGKRKI